MTGIVCNLVGCEDYMTRDSAHDVCGVHIVTLVFNQRLTRSEESLQKKELIEDKAELLDARKGLEAASKYTYQFIKDITLVMCSKVANKLYRQNSRRK